jgi:hypothetical protein
MGIDIEENDTVLLTTPVTTPTPPFLYTLAWASMGKQEKKFLRVTWRLHRMSSAGSRNPVQVLATAARERRSGSELNRVRLISSNMRGRSSAIVNAGCIWCYSNGWRSLETENMKDDDHTATDQVPLRTLFLLFLSSGSRPSSRHDDQCSEIRAHDNFPSKRTSCSYHRCGTRIASAASHRIYHL